MRIIIPHKDNKSPVSTNKEELLENLKEITPEQLTSIGEEMKAAREKRENERDKITFDKHRIEVSKFKEKIDNSKSKNFIWFRFEDSKVVENWETVWIVLLYDYSRDYQNSFSDLEYWKKLYIKIWDYETTQEIIYRDAYDPKKDDWSKAFTKIKRLEIQWNTLKIWLSKNEWSATLYEIKFPKPENIKKKEPIYMYSSEIKEFEEYIKSKEETLLKELTIDAKYPNIFWYGARQIPNLPVSNIPYDKAILADEYIDISTWEAYFVIKTQLDADSVKWKQYWWGKYRVSINEDKKRYYALRDCLETTLVEQFDAWEEELANWLKVKINAKD